MVLERKKEPPLGGLEPPTFRLTAERASQLRHRGLLYNPKNRKNLISSKTGEWKKQNKTCSLDEVTLLIP